MENWIMVSVLLRAIADWYWERDRWWLPLVLGIPFSICFAPFSHETSPAFVAFPLLGFAVLTPLFALAKKGSAGRAALRVYLFGLTASLSQFYWIGNVAPEGQRHLIVVGLTLLSFYMACYFLLAGMAFRFLYRVFPRLYIVLFPACWVLVEYLRGIGELAFAWTYVGYVFVPFGATAQLASVCGVLGLSFIVAFGNMLVWDVLVSHARQRNIVPKWMNLATFGLFLAGVTVWGAVRMKAGVAGEPRVRASLIQSDMDQLHWGNQSLDTCVDITESLVLESKASDPDLVVLPESGLFCYLERRKDIQRRVRGWSDSLRVPMVVGALHWDRAVDNPYYRYSVHNTAFFIDTTDSPFERYHKIMLVPVSEVMPFEAKLPILGRINLGEADFKRGTEPTVFSSGGLKLAPFICYEVIFPWFVRERVKRGANLLVNITNDGWFGRSTGPYQHAAMSRMRCIENGVSMVRCANSGISMVVDQFGRVVAKTPLYVRTVLTEDVSLARIPTPYVRYGDWPIAASGLLLAFTLGFSASRRLRRRTR